MGVSVLISEDWYKLLLGDGDSELIMKPLAQINHAPRTTPWIAGVGLLSTIATRAARWVSLSRDVWLGILRSISSF